MKDVEDTIMCYILLNGLRRKCGLFLQRRAVYMFCFALLMVVHTVMFVSYKAPLRKCDCERQTTKAQQYEMVCMKHSMRQLFAGRSKKQLLANTLLSDVGCRYIVRLAKANEKHLLLSSTLIYYARQRCNIIETSDPQEIINPHPFTYTLNNETMCGPDNGKDVFLLMYVHSAPKNAERRKLIRSSWGNRTLYGHTNVRLIFVLGTTSTSAVTDKLIIESSTYGDIVQSSFIDDYRNLTYKAISALKWVSQYCSNTKYVLKSDDDILVNPFTLIPYLSVNNIATGLVICKVYERGTVFRKGYRRLVTKEEYAGDNYPPFCSGSAHIMTTDVVIALYRTSYTVRFFWPDDVFITGLLPFKLNNITFVQIENRIEVLKTDKEVAATMTGKYKTRYIFGHIHDTDVFQKTWSNILASTGSYRKIK